MQLWAVGWGAETSLGSQLDPWRLVHVSHDGAWAEPQQWGRRACDSPAGGEEGGAVERNDSWTWVEG